MAKHHTGTSSRGESGTSGRTSGHFRPSPPPKFRPTVPEFSVPQFFRSLRTAAPPPLSASRSVSVRSKISQLDDWDEVKMRAGELWPN